MQGTGKLITGYATLLRKQMKKLQTVKSKKKNNNNKPLNKSVELLHV